MTESQLMCTDDFSDLGGESNNDHEFQLSDGLTDSCDDVESSSSSSDYGEVYSDSSTCSNSDSLLSEEFIAASCKTTSDSAMSHYECSLAIVSIAAKHNMSYSCVVDFLKLLTQLVPNSAIPKSQHMLMKQFVDYRAGTTVYHCCGFCTKLLPSFESLCLRSQCRLAKTPNSMFIAVDINKQLQLLFSSKLCYYIHMRSC